MAGALLSKDTESVEGGALLTCLAPKKTALRTCLIMSKFSGCLASAGCEAELTACKENEECKAGAESKLRALMENPGVGTAKHLLDDIQTEQGQALHACAKDQKEMLIQCVLPG